MKILIFTCLILLVLAADEGRFERFKKRLQNTWIFKKIRPPKTTTTTTQLLPTMCEKEEDKTGEGYFDLEFWDQKSTGSCWACAATDAVSIQAFLDNADNGLKKLSAQQLRECYPRGRGIVGNWMKTAFAAINNDGGVTLNDSYPFEEEQLDCRLYNKELIYKLDDYFPFSGKENLEQCIRSHIVIAAFHMVKDNVDIEGIFNVVECDETIKTNHYLIITGHKELEGKRYWVARNSYGDNHGDGGLIYISMEETNPNCLYEEMYVIKVKVL